MDKSLSNKYGQKLFDNAKKSATDAIKQHRKKQSINQQTQLEI